MVTNENWRAFWTLQPETARTPLAGIERTAIRRAGCNTPRPGWLVVALLTSLLLFSIFTAQGSAKDVLLTRQEKAWLASHPMITIAPDPAYPPIEFFDSEGRYQGIAADYVHLVEQKLGIRFQIDHPANWDEAIKKAKKREIDVFGAAAMTPQRSEYMLFTRPFVEFPSVIIVRKSVSTSLTLEQLAGMRVAIVSGYADHDYVIINYPHLDLDVVPTVENGLFKVSFGMVDALVANLGAASYFIEKEGISNLRVAGNTGYVYRLAFGCRNDWPELAAILEKALNEISPHEREAILNRWINLERTSLLTTRHFWFILLLVLGIALIALLGMLVWNHSLRGQVDLRTKELSRELAERIRSEEALRLSSAYNRSIIETTMDALVTINPEGQFSDVNAAAEEMSGYSRDQLVGSQLTKYFKDPDKAVEDLRRVCEEGLLRDYELEMIRSDGRSVFLLCNASPFRDGSERALGVCVVARDMTERRLVEKELHEYREHLEQLVRNRTSELAKANDQLQQEINEHRRTERALLESERKLRFMSSQLLTSQEAERQRIARELHDSIGQSLAAIKFNVENVLSEMAYSPSQPGIRALERTIPIVRNAIEEARRIYTGLRPSMLDDLGIIATLGWFCREFQHTYTGICIEQQISLNEEEIPEPLKIVIFRIVQEALNNIARHSEAELVNLSLARSNGRLSLTLEDNGVGFDVDAALARASHDKGLGISGMMERADHTNGSFSISSVSEEGTIIKVSWLI